MHRKIHLKGFSFTRQSRAGFFLTAAEADAVYGDEYQRSGNALTGVGNNVTLVYNRMDFGLCRTAGLLLEGNTPLASHPITLLIRNEAGEETTEAIDFAGGADRCQRFSVALPGGRCCVQFIFLPGSRFDFYGFRFLLPGSKD